VIPPAEPGVWRKVPGFVLDPVGPLAIRLSYLPKAAPWLIRYLAAGWTAARVERTAQALRTLLVDAPALHQELATRVGVPQLIERRGLLHAYPSRLNFEADALAWGIRRKTGVRWQEMDGEALHSLEPTLHPRYQFGVWVGEAGHCRNPGAYVKALVAHSCAQGAALVRLAQPGSASNPGG
jgi:D-amino-acid dehydrogenase